MRTTLDIDEDILQAAKEIARRSRRSAGAVISELARRALTETAQTATRAAPAEPQAFYGFKPQAARGLPVTDEMVDRLRTEAGD